MKIRLFALILLLSISTAFAQNQEKVGLKLFAGPTTPILDNGIGIQLSLNPQIELSDYFSVEGQLAYNNSRVTGSFLSGERGNAQAGTALGGIRTYIVGSQRNIRPYINLLLGAFALRESSEANWEVGISFSTGIYAEIDRWTVGFSFEGPQFLMFKLGFQVL